MWKRLRANLHIRAGADVIVRGKAYASAQGKSLSRLVEEYFIEITAEDGPPATHGGQVKSEPPAPESCRGRAPR